MDTIRRSYDGFQEGDVIAFNDPFSGGNHQADVVICRPMFVAGRLLGFAINRGHWTDVGGMAPGGWSGTARHVIQEALIIPPVKLYKAGVLDREVKDFILKNVRLPKQCWGDLQSQIASNIVAERRVRSLVKKYGIERGLEAMEEALGYSKRRFARMLERFPDGEYHGSDVMEDDGYGGGPYRINVTVSKKGHRIVVDFAATDPQVRGPINLAWAGTKACAYVAVMAVVDPFVPMNSGVLDLIEVKAPEGCLVRPVYPAPVFCWGDPGERTIEVVLQALAQMAPDRAIASSDGSFNNVTGFSEHPDTGEESLWYIFQSGGIGARPNKDGNNVEWPWLANGNNESMEIWEARYAVRFEKYEMVTDSGGPGRYRGGLGVSRQMQVLVPTYISGCGDRQKIRPWGLFGGKEAAPNRYSVIRGGTDWDFECLFRTLAPAKFSNLPLQAKDILNVTSGGGGGYGDPLDRDPQLVESDVLNGYVSPARAREEYGVRIDSRTGKFDLAKTTEIRDQIRRDKDKSASSGLTTAKGDEKMRTQATVRVGK
jgi:N-methylhydantoinase B/oxoprolinase/acetone carboxylase alpha subunit